MNKLKAFFTLFNKGEELINADTWKNGQITVTILVPFISAALVLGGVDIDAETIAAAAGGVIAIVNIVLTIITSKKVGL